MAKTFEVNNVEIFEPGRWNGKDWPESMVDEAVVTFPLRLVQIKVS